MLNDNLRIELLGKFASEKEITKQLRNRKRDSITETIKPKLKADYLADGWLLDRELKTL